MEENTYYKNDDGDETTFYSAPLSSLENLTIKILDSRGRSLSKTYNDSDRGTYNSSGVLNIDGKFLNNTFVKDNILNVNNGKEGIINRITNLNYFNNNMNTPDNGDISIKYDNEDNVFPNPPGNNDKLINLTNQIEYIFEVVTKEPDVEKDYIADLI